MFYVALVMQLRESGDNELWFCILVCVCVLVVFVFMCVLFVLIKKCFNFFCFKNLALED